MGSFKLLRKVYSHRTQIWTETDAKATYKLKEGKLLKTVKGNFVTKLKNLLRK